jgi:hypothetical protein
MAFALTASFIREVGVVGELNPITKQFFINYGWMGAGLAGLMFWGFVILLYKVSFSKYIIKNSLQNETRITKWWLVLAIFIFTMYFLDFANDLVAGLGHIGPLSYIYLSIF